MNKSDNELRKEYKKLEEELEKRHNIERQKRIDELIDLRNKTKKLFFDEIKDYIDNYKNSYNKIYQSFVKYYQRGYSHEHVMSQKDYIHNLLKGEYDNERGFGVNDYVPRETELKDQIYKDTFRFECF